jgi:hypothetical protein
MRLKTVVSRPVVAVTVYLWILVGCAPPFKTGTTPAFDAAGIRHLHGLLGRDTIVDGDTVPNWNPVLEKYFGSMFDSSLSDFVVFIRKDSTTRQGLILDGKLQHELPGKRHLWLLVFSESPFHRPPRVTTDSTMRVTIESRKDTTGGQSDTALIKADTAHTITTTTTTTEAGGAGIEVTLTSLEYKKDRVLVSLVKSLIGGRTPSDPAATRDTTVGLHLRLLGKTTDTTGDTLALYVAMHRFSLSENTRNRISFRRVAPSVEFFGDSARGIHYSFGNHSGSPFGVSLGAAVTTWAATREYKDTALVSRGADLRQALYLFGQFYPFHGLQPRLPWRSFPSLGLALGTNILPGGLLDDLVLGISFGRWKDLGLVVGLNCVKSQRLDGSVPKSTRDCGFLLGGDFAL